MSHSISPHVGHPTGALLPLLRRARDRIRVIDGELAVAIRLAEAAQATPAGEAEPIPIGEATELSARHWPPNESTACASSEGRSGL
jgi:hypothetical protein